MHQAVDQPSAHHAAAAQAGANGQVDKGVQALSRAPAVLAQGCAVDIAVKTHRRAQRLAQRAGEIGVAPVGLGRVGDIAKGGRARVGINRAKRCNADGGQGLFALLFAKIGDGLADTFFGCCSGKAHLIPQVIRAAAHCTDKLCAACFDAAVKGHDCAPSYEELLGVGQRGAWQHGPAVFIPVNWFDA